MDELKLMSDDSYFNEDHIRFLVNKHRANLLKQVYSKDNSNPSNSNYQTIQVPLSKGEEDDDFYFSNKDSYLKGDTKIPNLLNISKTKITSSTSRFGYTISLISKDRMQFVGHNKWLKNIIYCTIDDNILYVYTYYDDIDTSKVRFNIKGIFEDAEAAYNGDDFIDTEYPLDISIVPLLIQSVVQELSPKTITPEDSLNNASDDKSNIANYIARNTKSDLVKQLS